MSEKKYTSIKHDNAAGRVEFQGGKAVWHWAENSNDSTSILIKSLENPELELEATQRTPIPGPKPKAGSKDPAVAARNHEPRQLDTGDLDWDEPDSGSGSGSGFDPYNRS